MKKPFSLVLICIIVLPAFSMFGWQMVKATSSDLLSLPSEPYGQPPYALWENPVRAHLLSVSDQTISASAGQTVSLSITYQLWAPVNPSEIDQLFFIESWTPNWPPNGYTITIYEGVPGTYPGVTETKTISFTAPSQSGTYYLWFCFDAQYSMQNAINIRNVSMNGLPAHVKILVAQTRLSQVTVMSTHFPWKLTQSSAIWDGENAYVFGGGNETGPKNTIIKYNPVSDQVSMMQATLPDPVTDSCAIYDGQYAYVFGGYTGQPIYSNKIARYDPITDTVTVMAAKLSTQSMSAIWDGHYAYLFGGWDGYSYYNQILRYDPVKDEITTMNAKFPAGIKWASAVWTGTYAYIFGGNKDYDTAIDQIFRYDPVTDSVTTLTAKLPEKLYFTSAVWTSTYALIFGGSYKGGSGTSVTYYDTIIKFDPTQASTTVLTQTLPTPRRGTSAIWDGNSAYIFGGDLNNIAIDEIVRFAPTKHFDPLVDGFGFNNYPRQSDCMEITIKQLYDEMGYVPNSVERLLLAIYAFTLGQGQHNAGHCYGISRAAVYYFVHSQELQGLLEPLGLNTANQVSSYNSISAIRDKIEYEHVFGLYRNPNILFKKVAYALEFYTQLPSLEAEVNNIIDAINNQGYAFVTLCAGLGLFHSVVAYKGQYDESSDTYTLYFYDSNSWFAGGAGSDGSGHEHIMKLKHNSQGKLYISYDQDSHIRWLDFLIHEDGSITCMWEYLVPKTAEWFLGHISELWSSLMELANEAPQLWNQFVEWIISYARSVWGNVVELKLSCPAELHIYNANGSHVGLKSAEGIDMGFPALFFIVGDTQQVVLVNPHIGDYRIQVLGTGKGNFTLRISSIVNGTAAGEKLISGEISKGETKTYQISYETSGGITIKESFPLWIVGAAFSVVVLSVVVTLLFWRKKVARSVKQVKTSK